MIYTVTLNPAVDYEIQINELNLGSINHIDEQRFIPGGKGINVSRGLSFLGVDSKAVGFLGGFTGHFMNESLLEESFDSKFVTIKDTTRINLKIHEQHQMSEITGKAPRVSIFESEELMHILDHLKDEDMLILSGSQPRGQTDLFDAILKRYQQLNLKIILDVPGHNYHELLKYRPLLCKPNIDELKDFTHRELSHLDDIISAGKELVAMGSQSVIISMGEKGALYVDRTHIYSAKPINGTPRRLFGPGDHMVSGFVFGHLKGLKITDKFKYSVSCASLQIYEPSSYTLNKVEELIDQIEIEELPYD
ncbi:MAG: 1-phosphofructokinase [Acholeplasmataceae bacterium]